MTSDFVLALRRRHGVPGALPVFDAVPSTTALVVIDLQHLDASREGLLGRRASEQGVADGLEEYFKRLDAVTVPAAARLLEAFRRHRLNVIHTRIASLTPDGRELGWRYRHWGLGVGLDEFDARFLPEVAPIDGEVVLNKTTTSAFVGSHLDMILRNLGVETLVVCGVVTGGCVESTVRNGADLGYRVVVPEDACAALTTLAHENAILAMVDNFAWVQAADEVVTWLDATARDAGA